MEYTLNTSEKNRLGRMLNQAQSVFLGAPILADVDRISVAADWADGSRTIAAQPDCPRNLTATLTDANNSITGGTMVIYGRDILGRPVEETFLEPDGAGGGKTLTGSKIFAYVDAAIISGTTGSVGAGVDQVVIGVGDVIGLPMDIEEEEEVLWAYVDGALTTPDAVAAGESESGINCTSATYDGTKLMYAFVQQAAQHS